MNTKLRGISLAILFFISFLVSGSYVQCQTNPQPFNLSTGAYEFNAWDSASPAGTYPANMAFHFVPYNQSAPYYADGTSDYDCGYNMTKRPRINGLLSHGISLLTTSSSQYNDCNSGAASNRFIGAVVLSINATERSTIRLRWKSETVTPGDGNGDPLNPRIWKLRLQYRVDSSGLFTDVPGPVEFTSSTASGDSLQLGPTTLPDECNNKQILQLRWIYFESSAGAGGTRPKLRLDDIEVTSDHSVGISEPVAGSHKFFSIFPNPAHSQFSLLTPATSEGTIQVTNQVGKQVMVGTYKQSTKTFDCSALPKGLYFVTITDNQNGLVKTMKLMIQ